MVITILEALGRIKAAAIRIDRLHESMMHYLVQAVAVDPLDATGGSTEFVKRQLQAISDLENNLVRYRVAINKSNLETSLTLNGRTMSVTAWLVWKREVAKGAALRHRQIREVLQSTRQINERETAATNPRRYLIHIDEDRFTKEETELSNLLAELDTQLSLLNARVTVEVEVG